MDKVQRIGVGWIWFTGKRRMEMVQRRKQDRQGLEEKGGIDCVQRENKIKTRGAPRLQSRTSKIKVEEPRGHKVISVKSKLKVLQEHKAVPVKSKQEKKLC